MQDIDFDEIDRAVSSVTNNTARGASVPDAARPATSRSVVDAPSAAASVIVEPRTHTPAPVGPSPAMRRSSGRFMDVVHSSSDMRPSPTSSSVPPREETSRVSVPERVEPATPTEEEITPVSTGFHWPDPIDEPAVPTPSPRDTAEEATDDEVAPLESPFLSGAKIEKRPLGAFSGTEPETELPLIDDFATAPLETSLEAGQPEVAPDPELASVKADIPPELHEDLLMLEAHTVDEASLTHERVDPSPPPVQQESPSASALDTPTGPTSITQQYKEQPSASPDASGSIYDTESYHQPLKHMPKKHSGALVVVWIAALILVGGGIGLAVYYVLLPMLG